MNKNIKRTMAVALAVGVFSAVGPTKYVSLFTTEAHASSSDADELTDLQLETSSGSSINLYSDSSYDDELSDDPTVGDTYYAKTSASKVALTIDGADEDNVRIFKGSTAYEVGDDISISSDTTTTLKVRVYEDAYDEDTDYSSSDYNQYTIVVKSTTSTSDDDIDLSSIVLSNGYINFDKDNTSYNVNVAQDASSITVQATPEDTDYTVKIGGTTVNDDDDYKKTVSLSTGSNTIKIIVSDDDDNTKTYTLNVTKSAVQAVGQGTAGVAGQGAAGAAGQGGWQQVSGSWYYLDSTGTKKTGWIQDNGSWYYLQASGADRKSVV